MPDDDVATNDEPTGDEPATDAAAPAPIDDERAAYYAPDPTPEPVEADDERAAYYAPDGGTDDEGQGDEADDADEVSTDLTKAELVAEAEARGLATSGSKADLVARIEEHDAAEGEGVTDA